MGMAASQARFLGLTARKSNIEFQGQQINQARTALANEIMGLYGQYNGVKVPTAPSKYDFVNTKYSFESTYQNYEISDFQKIPDGEYKGYYAVELSYDAEIPKAYTKTLKDAQITALKDGNGEFSYLNFVLGTDNYTYNANNASENNIKKITENYENYPGLTTIMEQYGLTDGVFYAFERDGKTYYTSENDLKSTEFTPQGDKQVYYGDYTFDYRGILKEQRIRSAIAGLSQNKDGRMTAINILECDEDKDLVGKQFGISATQVDDEAGYLDAINQYNYDHDKYEKRLAEINAKIEKIQTQDRTLEMKLKQLDTEQKAISTEMDSVKEVINKTIDSVFKADK